MSSQFQCGVALVNHKCTTSVLVTGDRLSIMEPSRDQAQLPITKFISKITPRLHSMFYFPRCCAWTRGWQERSRCKRTGWMSENPTLFCWAGNYLSRIGIENSFHSHVPHYSARGNALPSLTHSPSLSPRHSNIFARSKFVKWGGKSLWPGKNLLPDRRFCICFNEEWIEGKFGCAEFNSEKQK